MGRMGVSARVKKKEISRLIYRENGARHMGRMGCECESQMHLRVVGADGRKADPHRSGAGGGGG